MGPSSSLVVAVPREISLVLIAVWYAWLLTRGGAFDGPASGGAGLDACTGLAGGGGGRDGGASPNTSMADGSTGFGGGGLGLEGAGGTAAALGPVGIGRLFAGEWFCFFEKFVNQYQVASQSRHDPIHPPQKSSAAVVRLPQASWSHGKANQSRMLG